MRSDGTLNSIKARYDTVVVGAGFSGIYALHKFLQKGLSVLLLEKGEGLGGTWFWNSYPGARCDVESMEYSYQFDEKLQQYWEWTERYASQPEILKYMEYVVERFNLRSNMRFGVKVDAATFDENSNDWTIERSTGNIIKAKYL